MGVKITSDKINDANALITSKKIAARNYRVFIPNSLKFSKCLVKDIDISVSVLNFVERLTPKDKEFLSTVKRRITFDNHILEALELTFILPAPPPNILVSSFEMTLHPLVPRPIRCFKCQRYRHVKARCRSGFRCEFCGERHEAEECENGLRNSKCCNCGGAHPSSSTTCPIYIREQEIRNIRAEMGIGYQDAEKIYYKHNNKLDKPDKAAPVSNDSVRNNDEEQQQHNNKKNKNATPEAQHSSNTKTHFDSSMQSIKSLHLDRDKIQLTEENTSINNTLLVNTVLSKSLTQTSIESFLLSNKTASISHATGSTMFIPTQHT
ncbi:uncharacterized protein LOC127284850 [Leptopilina boulardi]|uniref:uncharacterized protein LOC127284850 n=1 Tax=Leptopilina boulardi TaxID=63433 RepID=UPI0021F651F8|nr:uncharacterized protein LOC127284850 [Leptopilina boulardi]